MFPPCFGRCHSGYYPDWGEEGYTKQLNLALYCEGLF
ncbi:hypothetical protein ES703_69744 [subsurface metagenome]